MVQRLPHARAREQGGDKRMDVKIKKSDHVRTVIAHVVLVILSFLCLFFFYILVVNATRSHSDLQKGFSALPGGYLIKNFLSVANDGTFPMFKGILNSLIVSGCSAAICTYFSSLTAHGLYAYDFKLKRRRLPLSWQFLLCLPR